MRVIYFSSSYGPHDHRFLASLANTGHEVHYLRLGDESVVTERRPIPPNIEQVHWIGSQRSYRWREVPALARELRGITRRINPDLIHAGPIQTCAFVSAVSGFRPLLTMSWGFDLMQDAYRNPAMRWMTSFTLRRSAYFASDAQATCDRAVALGMRRDRTAVFPWGIDLRLFAPGSREPNRAARDRRRGQPEILPKREGGAGLVFFCNRSWEPRYGVDILARAFAEAVRENPRIRLVLVGTGSQGQDIKGALREVEASGRVLFPGRLQYSELPRWYRLADVFVSPSHVDGSSVSLMEALACGVPALVSDIPANREWVQDGVNGWLFPDGDTQALTGRILELARRRSSFSREGESARMTAEKKADWKRNFGVLLEAYERAVHQN